MTATDPLPEKIAEQLKEPVDEARELARKLGLDPFPVNYWIVDYDDMNELIAYNGFQRRYPHWRFGMQYQRQAKKGQFLGGKAFEIVNNDNPAHAFLQESNTITDQKAVITHVEAHSDFFANNQWFTMDGEVDAVNMLARHADKVEAMMENPENDRDEIERWIDNLQCLMDNIDQHRPFEYGDGGEDMRVEDETAEGVDLSELDLTDEVEEEVFDSEWLEEQAEAAEENVDEYVEEDVLAFLYRNGNQYDEKSGKAVEMEAWQKELIEIMREEAYYFAAQKMTKVMNEGWAAYWESMMMGDERFADDNEFMTYADHQSRVLNSPGLNPYKLGKELWDYIESTTNREEVVTRLLRVNGITAENFFEMVDFDEVETHLTPPDALLSIGKQTLDTVATLPEKYLDMANLRAAQNGEIDVSKYPWKVLSYEGLARRNYSLSKLQNQSFIEHIPQSEVEDIERYLMDTNRYETIHEAMEDVTFTEGWDTMREIRESHNDVTFIDTYLTQEFVENNHYFTYEFSHQTGSYHATGNDYKDVKKKLLLDFTNFGKPTIVALDKNYNNRNELLLAHQYNGVMLDMAQATDVLPRIHQMWGRPVNLQTITKELTEHEGKSARRRGEEPEPTEQGKLIRYEGTHIEMSDIDEELADIVTADDVDYDTKPDDWLSP